MCKSVLHLTFWVVALVLLLAAGAARAQEQDQPSSSTPVDNPATAAEAVVPDVKDAPDTVDLSNGVNAMNADLNAASSPYSGLPALGTPAPLQFQNSGPHLGPFYLASVSDSAYYSTINNSQGGQYSTFWGDNLSAGITLAHQVGQNGHLSFVASPQVLFASGHTWFNEVSGLSFSDQLTDHWTIYATSALAYFQNSILTNPQYALVNTSAGFVLQTIYAQTIQPSFYQYANFGATYQIGEKTTLSLSPVVGVSLTNSAGPLNVATQFGGSASVAHQYSSKGSVSVFYSFVHSTIPSANTTGPNGWNSSSFGVGISQGLGGETWSLAFNVASSTQSTPNLTWSVVGNAALIKKFGDGSSNIMASYTRSQAALLTQTPGYFDQGSISYNRRFGDKTGMNVGVGAYRSDQNLLSIYVGNASGVRVSGSVFYRFLPSLSATAGFFVGQQNGAGGNQLYLFNGRSTNFNIGLTWTPGRQATDSAPNPWGLSNGTVY